MTSLLPGGTGQAGAPRHGPVVALDRATYRGDVGTDGPRSGMDHGVTAPGPASAPPGPVRAAPTPVPADPVRAAPAPVPPGPTPVAPVPPRSGDGVPVRDRPGPVARMLTALVIAYRRWISPALPARCRFYPSCSAYALESLTVHGAVRGTGLTIWRLLRCQPFHPGGYDPVPPPKRRRNGEPPT